MAARRAPIRTPDQRIRVFVSSTLRELEPERLAARAVIERLRMAPVMFELGARPHPPRELYRAYLAQSDIFVGIYGSSYGWVAPGEDVSGLEDEYRLSGSLPSLIYVKDPAPQRDDRLDALLERIRADDRSSYKSFRDADELAALLADDIATLLAERFDTGQSTPSSAAHAVGGIPAPYNALVGREPERRAVLDLLEHPETRLVTITGAGGIGKSRLAIEIATDAARTGREVAFALLESVSAPDRVLPTIARALGVQDAAGQASLEEAVIAGVADRAILLVIDNMEHLLAAAPLLVRLIAGTSRLQLLVTSRSPLRLRAERIVEVGPLAVPGADGTRRRAAAADLPTDAAEAAAVVLFVQRASVARPGFRLTAQNLPEVVAICRALDGVPLALELAASRVRSLSCAQILKRLDSVLALLVSGSRDLPERQRTLRATLEWSVGLLDDEPRAALAALATFTGSFVFDAAESVLSGAGVTDPLAALEALVDASLVARADRDGVPVFRLLSLVRAYAGELGAATAREQATRAWIAHYRTMATDAAEGLRGDVQLEWLAALEREAENLLGVGRALLDRRELDGAADYLWSLYLYLWIGGYLGFVPGWMTELLQIADRERVELAARTRAIALYYINANRFWQDPSFDPVPQLRAGRDLFAGVGDVAGAALTGVSIGLALLAQAGAAAADAAPEGAGSTDAARSRAARADAAPPTPRHPPAPPAEVVAAVSTLEDSLAGFREVGDAWGQAMALVTLGRLALLGGDLSAAQTRFEESLSLAETQGERLGIVIALNHRGWVRFFGGDADGAGDDFARALDLSLALGHDEGIAYGLEGFVGLRAAQGDVRAAGLLLGAAQALRRQKGIINPGAYEFALVPLGALRAAGSGDALDAAVVEGERLTVAEALQHVRG
ncbi:ATP-binding protein [Microbacterium sp.]|uniref:ATP-binding protein n=1 Tax=Microbacterium sp. TaxID=51671 RepID=UPI0039E4A6F9